MTLTTDDRRESQVEKGSRRTRDRYADLFDFAPVGYLTLDEKGVISRANLASAALLGFDPIMLRGSRFDRLVHEEDVGRWGQFLSDLVRGGDRKSCDLEIWRRDGSAFAGHVDGWFRAFLGPESSVLVVLTDISVRKRAEAVHERARAALAASEEHFRKLVQRLPIPTALANPSREIVYVNDEFTRVLGYGRADVPTMEPGTGGPIRTRRIAAGWKRPGVGRATRQPPRVGACRPPRTGSPARTETYEPCCSRRFPWAAPSSWPSSTSPRSGPSSRGAPWRCASRRWGRS